jgi:hypothetical protein
VLIVLDRGPRGGRDGWPEPPEHRFTTADARWEGLGDGHGHLRARRVTIETGGRRGADRALTVDLWLPAADGRVAFAERLATVRPLRPVDQSVPAAAPTAPSRQ